MGSKKQKYQHAPNPERVRAENERRRSNAAVPFTTTSKRLGTREREVAAELAIETDTVFCQKCGSPTCGAILLHFGIYDDIYPADEETPYTTETGDPSVLPKYDRIDDI